MSEILSNDQVAALVEAAREGQLPTPTAEHPARRPKRVRDVDFMRPSKFAQEQQRRIERGHESFCRTVSTQLSAELRAPVELSVINIDQQAWSSAFADIPHASLFAVLETSHGTRIVLGVEQRPMMLMIERMLGGVQKARAIEREPTDVELTLAHRIFDTIVSQLSRTWEDLMSTTLTLVAVESQQANVQLVPSSEPTLAITIEVLIESLSSTLTLLLPHRSIEAALEHLSTGYHGDVAGAPPDEQTEEAVRAALRSVAVELRAEIGSRDLTVSEVLALRPGDVVVLGPASDGGTLYADSVPIHRTKPGRSGTRRAVEIVDRIEAT